MCGDVRLVCWSFVHCHFVAVVAVSFHFFPCAEFPHVVRPFHDRILFLHSHRGVVQFVLRNRVQCQYLRRNLQIWHIVFGYEIFAIQRVYEWWEWGGLGGWVVNANWLRISNLNWTQRNAIGFLHLSPTEIAFQLKRNVNQNEQTHKSTKHKHHNLMAMSKTEHKMTWKWKLAG